LFILPAEKSEERTGNSPLYPSPKERGIFIKAKSKEQKRRSGKPNKFYNISKPIKDSIHKIEKEIKSSEHRIGK
jgi:hypothetical protein